MKSFSIFPHKGYLNTDFQIKVFDNESHTFYYDDNCPIENVDSFRLPAGMHRIKSDTPDEECDEVEVEDAIRLGGSKVEAGYCFDNSPWVVAVMKDRTYFLNSNTGTHYVENGISPLKITALKNDLLLFEYGNKSESGTPQVEEYAVFNAAQGKVEKSFDKYIFHNSDMALFTDKPTEGGVCLHIMYFDDNLRILDIQCKSFTVFEEVVYYCAIDDEKYKIKKLEADGTGTDIPSLCGSKDRFVDFALNQYYITKGSRNDKTKRLYLNNISGRIPSASIGEDGMITMDVNGIKTGEFTNVNDCFSFVTDNRDTFLKMNIHNASCLEYQIYQNTEGIYEKITHHRFDLDTGEKKIVCELYKPSISDFIDDKKMTIIGRWDEILVADTFVVVANPEKKKIVRDGEFVRELTGITIMKTPQGKLIYYKDEDDVRSVYQMGALEDKLLVRECKNNINLNFVEKYGILTESANQHRILHIDEGRWVKMPHHKYMLLEKNGKCFLDNCDKDGQSYLLTATTDPIALPINVSKILSISPNGSSILSESPRGIILHERYSSDSTYEINEKLIDAIDTSEYRNALFSEDGSHTIYQKNDAWYYYNTETEKEVEFEMIPEVLKCQRKGMYGMNFYAHFNDTNRRIDLIDPLSLQKIAPVFLDNYMFVSPSGKLASKTNKTDARIKYFLSNRKKGSDEMEFNEDVTDFISEKRLMEVFVDKCHKCEDSAELFSETKMRQAMYRCHNYNLEQRVRHLEFAFPGSNKEEWEKEMIGILSERLNKKEGYKDRFCLYAKKYAIIDVLHVETEEKFASIELPVNLHFLNRIVFSGDDRYVAICGKTDLGGNYKNGFIGVYDLVSKDWIYGPYTPNLAIWKSFFTIDGCFAYYNSKPDAMCGNLNDGQLSEIVGRSILTFSRSGKYIAMSDKGYIPFAVNPSCWGHMRSANIYVRRVGNDKELRFSDHGDEIMDLRSADVTSVSFSPDDKKLMSVSQDGVIIIRNLHLEELQEANETESQRSEFRVVLEETDNWADPEAWMHLRDIYFYEGCGVFYTKDRKKLVACVNDLTTEYCVREGCEVICNESFAPCISLSAAVDSMATGEDVDFENNLTIVSLPKTIRVIGKTAFSGCKKLKEIRIPKGCMEKFKQMICSETWDKLVEC